MLLRKTWRAVVLGVAVGFVGCGGGGSPTSPTPPTPAPTAPAENRPPVISSVSVEPVFGVVDLQQFAFLVTASDPDGDVLSYIWDTSYMPGSTAPGRSVLAIFSGGRGGPVTVTVTVADSKGLQTSGSTAIVLATAWGQWTITEGGGLKGTMLWLSQVDGQVSGQYNIGGTSSTLEALTAATVTADGVLTLPLRMGSREVTLTGRFDQSSARITGTMAGALSGPFTMAK